MRTVFLSINCRFTPCLALYMLEIRKERWAIVKTLSTTSMLDKLGKLYNVPVFENRCWLQICCPKNDRNQCHDGRRGIGRLCFPRQRPERDGILAGLYMLDFMVKTGKKPSELLQYLFSKVGPHYYDRIDTTFTGDRVAREESILSAKTIHNRWIEGHRLKLPGWV